MTEIIPRGTPKPALDLAGDIRRLHVAGKSAGEIALALDLDIYMVRAVLWRFQSLGKKHS
jgi:hypothetical protein